MWYVGQYVVCVKNHSKGIVKKGQTFPVKGVKEDCCNCGLCLLDVGLNSPQGVLFVQCPDCGKQWMANGAWWLSEELFAPIDLDEINIEEVFELELQEV